MSGIAGMLRRLVDALDGAGIAAATGTALDRAYIAGWVAALGTADLGCRVAPP